MSHSVSPEAESEHPDWPADAWYVSQMLAALTANPSVWASTAKNDGYFDNLVPPTPPMSAAQGMSTVSTVNEIHPGTASANHPAGPYGLGARVPMLLISPWSNGGWVCLETFDATSTIRFIERRFGVQEPNISPWRRSICGDLTSAFDFSTASPTMSRLPSAAGFAPPQAEINATTTPSQPGDRRAGERHADAGAGPATGAGAPVRLQVDAVPNASPASVTLTRTDAGSTGAWLHVRTANDSQGGGSTGPCGYTVEAGKSLTDTWTAVAGACDLAVLAHSGFYRRHAGGLGTGAARIVARLIENVDGSVSVLATDVGHAPTTCTLTDPYGGGSSHQLLTP